MSTEIREMSRVTLSEAAVRLGITRDQAIALCIRHQIGILNGRVYFSELQRATAEAVLSE